MFREMRRIKQQLPPAEAEAVLRKATSGVLALLGDEGYPYAVPLSYVYSGGSLFFHCAVEGHKLDAIRHSPKASFCVIAQDDVLPEKYTTRYVSVIAFGQVRILQQPDEKRAAIGILAEKYIPDDPEGRLREIEDSFGRMCLLELKIEHLTGKQGRQLMLEKEAEQQNRTGETV